MDIQYNCSFLNFPPIMNTAMQKIPAQPPISIQLLHGNACDACSNFTAWMKGAPDASDYHAALEAYLGDRHPVDVSFRWHNPGSPPGPMSALHNAAISGDLIALRGAMSTGDLEAVTVTPISPYGLPPLLPYTVGVILMCISPATSPGLLPPYLRPTAAFTPFDAWGAHRSGSRPCGSGSQ